MDESSWRRLAEAARLAKATSSPLALILGGETTSTVKGYKGRGGRNQEVALAAVVELEAVMAAPGRVEVLAAATDGIDGPTDAAGAEAFWQGTRHGHRWVLHGLG